MIKVDFKGFDKLRKDLDKAAKKAFPHAARATLNAAAAETRKAWVNEVQRTMVTRNTFTTRSLQYDKATGTNVLTMQSKVGSTAPYMKQREEGETKTPRSGKSVPIPTSASAGQAPGSKRTRLVRSANKMRAINLPTNRGRTRQQRNAIALQAARKGGKFAFLETATGKRVIAKVTGGKRRMKVTTIWDLSARTVRVRPMPTLEKTLAAIGPRIPAMAESALLEQLRRHKVLGY